jgi:serine/threonine protein kinase
MVYNFKKITETNEPDKPYNNGYCPITLGILINNNYTIDKYLGQGAYSQVWRAFDTKNNIYVVLKIHKGNKKDNKVGMYEYKLLETLDHPNIIKAYNSFIYKSPMGKHYVMVLEYLGDVLKKCKYHFRGDYEDTDTTEISESLDSDAENDEEVRCIPPDILKRIMNQILEALNYLHNTKNIIHTDLKLENIMLSTQMYKIKNLEDFNIKLIDFGTSHSTNSKLNYNVGTYEYNSPEMILGYPYNTLTDVWSCGCIFFELLTGYCLFDYNLYYDNNKDDDESVDSIIYSDSSDEEDDEYYHIENILLAMMVEILGKMPGKLFKRGKYYRIYFNNKGNLKYIPRFLKKDKMYDYLKDYYNYSNTNAQYFEEILLLMLNNNPDKRYNVKKILNHSYFN